jgi:hypothetical protein
MAVASGFRNRELLPEVAIPAIRFQGVRFQIRLRVPKILDAVIANQGISDIKMSGNSIKKISIINWLRNNNVFRCYFVKIFFPNIAVLASIIIFTISNSYADFESYFEKNSDKIEPIFNKYISSNKNIYSVDKSDPNQIKEYPGWIAGEWTLKTRTLFFNNWPYRKSTYEILFPSKSRLAELIYSLACFTKDLDKSISLARFKRGAQGFHYSVDQLVLWANSFIKHQESPSGTDAKSLLEKLSNDQILVQSINGYESTGKILHIIGAAPGKKRSLELNLNHERWHVKWDEDVRFRELSLRKWQALPTAEKNNVFRSFPGYNHERKMQIIEEWAVKGQERNPIR